SGARPGRTRCAADARCVEACGHGRGRSHERLPRLAARPGPGIHRAGARVLGRRHTIAARYGDRRFGLATTDVGGELFEVLGARPALGRLMRPSDDSAGSEPPVVLSYGAWRTTF